MADRTFLTWPFFDDHHRVLAAELEEWAAANVAGDTHHVGNVDDVCRDLVSRLAAGGWLEYSVPAEGGGRFEQLDVRSLCLIRETLARYNGLADFSFAMQGLGTGPITLAGTAEQKDRYLAEVRQGKRIAAFALSEPEAGSDVAALAATAERDGDGFVLNGSKTWISNGGIADFYTVFVRTGEAPGARGLSAFIVDADNPGLDIAERIDVIAPHPLARLEFKDCRIPASAMLGAPGEGFKIAMSTLDIFRSTVGGAALGFARRALDEAAGRAQRRHLFGAPMGDLQLVQGMIADMALEVDAAALLVYRAAWTKDNGAARVTREAAMAKLHATESAQKVIDRAVQIFGGEGVVSGSAVEQLYREIRALRIYEGASEVQKVVIARQVLGEAAGEVMDSYTAHIDTFARDNLPPEDQWPTFQIDRPEFQYPEKINCAAELVDVLVEQGMGDRIALRSPNETWTYSELLERANRIANVLVDDLGLVTGNRVLLRSANNPMLVACWLGVAKAGGINVATMPLLRAKELNAIAEKAQVDLALCDERLGEEMELAVEQTPVLQKVVYFNDSGEAGAGNELERLMAARPATFANVETGRDDVVLIGFTSGTTGSPKGTMHFHRDLLIICDAFPRSILRPTPDDVFIGSPPLAFTFGLGGLATFPLRHGASSYLLEAAPPPVLLPAIADAGATICFTAPSAYRAMVAEITSAPEGKYDLSSLRACVSAGEGLPLATYNAWLETTGVPMIDGLGATEMLHIFIATPRDAVRPGATGKPIPGYEACVMDEDMNPLPPGEVGRLAVRGPTGCRYLADERQHQYVVDGWNLTGDAYRMDEDGYFWFEARADDMIISAGYNIAGPEVEDALLSHGAVAECAVVGVPDEARGQIVKAFVVPSSDAIADDGLAKALQDHVKQRIAPYKYPRAVAFVGELPKTESGKIQRFRLRENAE